MLQYMDCMYHGENANAGWDKGEGGGGGGGMCALVLLEE